MSQLIYHIFKSEVVLNFDGKTISIPASDIRYHQVIALINQDLLNEVPMVADTEKVNKLKELLKIK